jgi:hypothetical protein
MNCEAKVKSWSSTPRHDTADRVLLWFAMLQVSRRNRQPSGGEDMTFAIPDNLKDRSPGLSRMLSDCRHSSWDLYT